MDNPAVIALLITYKRTDLAIRTIEGVRKHLGWANIGWHLADDGSGEEHLNKLREAIGPTYAVTVSDAARKGVGHSMNLGMEACLKRADYILWLEDDWELVQPFDLTPCVKLLEERQDIGMVRLAYISPGIEAQLVSGAGRLWWKLHKGPTYTFTGHASLRHRRFCEAYGPYPSGLTPGETELAMCGKFNNSDGPAVALPAWTGEWGPFHHIGSESLKDVAPA